MTHLFPNTDSIEMQRLHIRSSSLHSTWHLAQGHFYCVSPFPDRVLSLLWHTLERSPRHSHLSLQFSIGLTLRWRKESKESNQIPHRKSLKWLVSTTFFEVTVLQHLKTSTVLFYFLLTLQTGNQTVTRYIVFLVGSLFCTESSLHFLKHFKE